MGLSILTVAERRWSIRSKRSRPGIASRVMRRALPPEAPACAGATCRWRLTSDCPLRTSLIVGAVGVPGDRSHVDRPAVGIGASLAAKRGWPMRVETFPDRAWHPGSRGALCRWRPQPALGRRVVGGSPATGVAYVFDCWRGQRAEGPVAGRSYLPSVSVPGASTCLAEHVVRSRRMAERRFATARWRRTSPAAVPRRTGSSVVVAR